MSLAAGLVAFVLVRIATRRRAQGSRRALALAAAGLLVAGVAAGVGAAARGALPRRDPRPHRTAEAPTPSGSVSGATRSGSPRRARSSAPGSARSRTRCPASRRPPATMRVEHAENDYVELLAEGGLGAAGLAGLLIAVGPRPGLRSVRDEPHRAARGIRAGALAGVAALLVHSAFDFNLRIPSNALLFGLLVAIVLRPGPRGDRGPRCGAAAILAAGAPRGPPPRDDRARARASRTRGSRVASVPPLSRAPRTLPRPRCAGSRSSARPASISAGGLPTPRPGSLSRGCGRRRRLRRRPRSRPGPSTSTPSTSPSDAPRSEWRALRSSRAGRSRRASRTPGGRPVASRPRATRAVREARAGSAPAG